MTALILGVLAKSPGWGRTASYIPLKYLALALNDRGQEPNVPATKLQL
jgi:hypothetical protein